MENVTVFPSPSIHRISSSVTNSGLFAAHRPDFLSYKMNMSFSSGLIQEALEHLASIELNTLCNEAKVESCRATRDLRSCGRYVQHVLNSCGHASLCAECSQRCDHCPLCRTPIPKNGIRLRARLYNECLEAGLISKKYDDRFQQKDSGVKQLEADVQRLYSFFDVALENNLVSLICHYITDVCMDENAASSDPVLAFLLDEVVVKDWCARTFGNIVEDIREIYTLGMEEMNMKLSFLQKFLMQLSGISNVLDVLESSFKDTLSAQLHDLNCLSEDVLRAKQHLETMTWCLRHQFLENIESRHPNFETWSLIVCERKSAASKRSWPNPLASSKESLEDAPTLFIEDALLHLGIEQEGMGDGLVITCLQKDANFTLKFRSKIEDVSGCCYPFENIRAAADILFLHGSSDLVVAKRAIFLYYMFDRYWTRPDAEWRHLIDDFAATFGITRHSLLESLAFYLLDDNKDQALQEACCLLPEIASPETHPKIAQVLLERQQPDAALMILRCSGRDGLSAYANSGMDGAQLISLGEVVTAVRVRVECGLLTEAFMYQRTYCLKMKEEKQKHGANYAIPSNSTSGYSSWLDHVDVLVTEMCHLCIRRNLLDRMIELPWDSDEEKYLQKCLYDYACQDPSTTAGSLLVVFYLQRYRYVEAYQVDLKLRSLEQEFISMSEEVPSRIKSISQWRAGLVDKCIDLLPEIQQQQVKSGSFDRLLADELGLSTIADQTGESQPNPITLQPTSSINSSVVFGTDLTLPSGKTFASGPLPQLSGWINKSSLDLSNYRPPSILHGKLFTSSGLSSPRRMDLLGFGRDTLAQKHISTRESRFEMGTRQDISFDDAPEVFPGSHLLSSYVTPLRELNRSAFRAPHQNLSESPQVHHEKASSGLESNGSADQVENVFKYSARDSYPTVSGKRVPSDSPWNMEHADNPTTFSWSTVKRDSPVERDLPTNGGLRWRSDETSDDEEGPRRNRAPRRNRFNRR